MQGTIKCPVCGSPRMVVTVEAGSEFAKLSCEVCDVAFELPTVKAAPKIGVDPDAIPRDVQPEPATQPDLGELDIDEDGNVITGVDDDLLDDDYTEAPDEDEDDGWDDDDEDDDFFLEPDEDDDDAADDDEDDDFFPDEDEDEDAKMTRTFWTKTG